MSEEKPTGLQRFSPEQQLPPGFDKLPEADQLSILKRMNEKLTDNFIDANRAINKSRTAENDLHVHNENVARLDYERKIYSSKVSAETGSGKIDMQVRGGDTRFIVPILIVIGIILLGLIMIFALR